MKTPEQLAEEEADRIERQAILCVSLLAINDGEYFAAKKAYKAGYQAAKDEYKEAIDTYNDVAKQMMEEAVRIMSPQDQLADADKVMFCVYCNDTHKGDCAVGKGKNHPALAQTKWISVKERLPPPETEVLWWNKTAHQAGVSSWEYMSHCNDTMLYWGDAGNISIKNFTHWMPLPEAPKEEEPNFVTSGKWISVKDRLPKPNTLVVILHEDEMNLNYRKPPVYFGKHNGQYWVETLDHSDVAWSALCRITHWMSLPEAPKEEE